MASAKMTSRQFKRFQREFIEWQMRLNLCEYTITFKTKPYHDRYAEIDADPEGCIALVLVNEAHKWTDEQIDNVAKHECIHLLLARLTEIGSRRFCDENELSNENERITCVLEKLL